MTVNVFILNGIILFYIIQRISEIFLSKKNEKWLRENLNAIEVNPKESLRMRVFHTLWFIALITEANIKREFHSPLVTSIIGLLLILGLIVRFSSMRELKQFWTIKIFSMKGQEVKKGGFYRYLRHPNYLVVIVEFILIPLLFKAYLTMILFSILNLFVLKERIKLEEDTIMSQTNYTALFAKKKRLIPFLLTLLLSVHTAKATEVSSHHKDFNEAKKSESFIKFGSTSTKLGMITSTFEGYAKDASVNYDIVNDQITHLEVKIPSKGIDTDNGSRNERMYEEILEANKYPVITATLAKAVPVVEGEKTVDMIFTIRDNKITRPVKYNIKRVGAKYLITGTSSISLKEAKIKDPSIVIATVRDLFDLSFAISL